MTIDFTTFESAHGGRVKLLRGERVSHDGVLVTESDFSSFGSVIVEVQAQLAGEPGAGRMAALEVVIERSADGESWVTVDMLTFTESTTLSATDASPSMFLRLRASAAVGLWRLVADAIPATANTSPTVAYASFGVTNDAADTISPFGQSAQAVLDPVHATGGFQTSITAPPLRFPTGSPGLSSVGVTGRRFPVSETGPLLAATLWVISQDAENVLKVHCSATPPPGTTDFSLDWSTAIATQLGSGTSLTWESSGTSGSVTSDDGGTFSCCLIFDFGWNE